ncbi:MAG: alkylphosphonate utilization operon protein PhnA, partial [Thermoleophilia bacterium]|nr:alkylphosphonate utilization operon protein PhnA [Thermoleophilia bacterium]
MPASLPPCPECSSEYAYEMPPLLVCPQCGNEWSAASTGDSGEPEARVIRDAVGNVLS